MKSVAKRLRNELWHSIVREVAYDQIGSCIWEDVKMDTHIEVSSSVPGAVYARGVMGDDFPWVTNWIERVHTMDEAVIREETTTITDVN